MHNMSAKNEIIKDSGAHLIIYIFLIYIDCMILILQPNTRSQFDKILALTAIDTRKMPANNVDKFIGAGPNNF